MRNVACRRTVLVLCVAVASFGCGRAEKSGADARHYEVRGIIRAFSPNRETIEIEHEDIPGFMPAMTMPFTLRDAGGNANVKLGDAVAFRLNVTNRDSWIDHLRKIDPQELKLPAPAPRISSEPNPDAQPRLREGDPMADFRLTDQDGKPVTRQTFHGHPFVITFIFTRCPIPNFCPLMSRNFEEIQSAITAGSGALAQTKLLSISFDPEFDTPQVLRDYAARTQTDSAIWMFATGTPAEIGALTNRFAVLVQPEGGTISHGLATALIDANGRVVEIWRGNGWKAEEVVAKIKTL